LRKGVSTTRKWLSQQLENDRPKQLEKDRLSSPEKASQYLANDRQSSSKMTVVNSAKTIVSAAPERLPNSSKMAVTAVKK
ncbi:hypothetical protein MMC31_003811, partial [Peltigera leucophlebia]|nr:hypothetical protein [Peltigera leucophlebia]